MKTIVILGTIALLATINLGLALTIVAGLVGLPLLWSVVIDVLKLLGVVTDRTAGQWSAGFSILSLLMVLVAINFFPQFDLHVADTLLGEIAQFATIILGFLTQILVARGTHAVTARIFPALSFSRSK